MSLFPTFYGLPSYSGYDGWGVNAAFAPLAPPVTPDQPVRPSEPVETQGMTALVAGPRSYQPAFDKAPPWSIAVGWQMRRYSAIVLGHATLTAPILAGTQTIEIVDDKGKPDLAAEWKDKATKHVLPLLTEIMPGALESPNFGHWLHCIIWDKVDGMTVPAAAQSFLPGEAIIYRDKYRRFAGFKVGEEYRQAHDGFLAVHLPHLDPLYGFPRTENCREDWWRVIQSNQNCDRTERKASGMQMAIGVPNGMTWTDTNGKKIFPQDLMQTILDAAVAGNGFVYPNIPFLMKDILAHPELLGKSAIEIKQLDWGNIGPAILAQIERMDALDKRIMRAYGRPEREAMEGKFGTKAESGIQGAIGTLDCERFHASLMHQFSQQTLRYFMQTNAGDDAPVLQVKASPLADPQQEFLQQVYTALLANTATGPQAALRIDEQALAKRVEVPVVPPEEFAQRQAQAEKDAQDKLKQQQDAMKSAGNGNPPPNGQNGNGKLALSAEQVFHSLNRISGFLEPDESLALSAETDGHWVTINGEHVLIGEGGVIEKGPAHLTGKLHPTVEAKRKQTAEAIAEHHKMIEDNNRRIPEIAAHPTAKQKDKDLAIAALKQDTENRMDEIETAKQQQEKFEADFPARLARRQGEDSKHELIWKRANDAWDKGETLNVGTRTRVTPIEPKNRSAMRLHNGRIQIRQGKEWGELTGETLGHFASQL